MEDRSIRLSGGSGLFYFTVLCSYANFRTSYKRIGGINYTIYPGEWICRIDELTTWFRLRFQYQALALLDKLQEQHLISYTQLGRGRVIKFSIKGWRNFNTILDYNAPCQKDTGFFFLPISKASDIISMERCSEMDIILDLWLNTIYNDDQVQASEIGPVVYMRNGSGSPLISYSDLAERWGISKATVGRILRKLEEKDFLALLTFPGRHGSAIYLNSYLSTMFQISDVMIDKEEVAMSLNLRISIDDSEVVDTPTMISEDQIIVSNEIFSVSKPHITVLVKKVAEMLITQGVACCGCSHSLYKLSPLFHACTKVFYPQEILHERGRPEQDCWILEISCGEKNKLYVFELSINIDEQSLRRKK